MSKMIDEIDLEDLLCWLGIDYKLTSGSSGQQLNLQDCPRCGGTNWKVYFNAESGLGNCFHGDCQLEDRGFNIFTFVQALSDGSATEARNVLERYARELGWRPPRRSRTVILSKDFRLPASQKITNDPSVGLRYCMDRGFDSNTAMYYGWRYAESGVFIYEDQEGRDRQQWYKKRLLIPVFDMEGKLATFQGRDMTGNSPKKYLFPPGLAGSGRFLYDAHNATGKLEAVLCEGVFDVAATAQALNVSPMTDHVAVMGTFGISLSGSTTDKDQSQIGQLLELKHHGLSSVTMLWDGSTQAVNAALNACQKLNYIGLTSYIAVLPLDKDPNEVQSIVVRRAFETRVEANMSNILKLKARLR